MSWPKRGTSSAERNAKISASLSGHTVSDETRNKIGASNKGKSLFPNGRVFSEEHRSNLSKSGVARYSTDESRIALGNNMRGKKMSSQTRERMSEARKQEWLSGSRKCDSNHKYLVGDTGVAVRNYWEYGVAIWLCENAFRWTYEEIVYRLIGTSYTPDFHVYDCHGGLLFAIEVKGYFRDPFKFQMFKWFYPFVEIELWDFGKLKSMGIPTRKPNDFSGG